MSEYRSDVNKYAKEATWTIGKMFVFVVLPLMVFGFVASLIAGVFNVASQPGRIVQKTLDADNVIQKYEWFHDVYTQQGARINQITQFKSFLSGEQDRDEKQRLRMEMAAQQMSCRDLAAKYNANSEKMNVGIFRGWSLPEKLNPYNCE